MGFSTEQLEDAKELLRAVLGGREYHKTLVSSSGLRLTFRVPPDDDHRRFATVLNSVVNEKHKIAIRLCHRLVAVDDEVFPEARPQTAGEYLELFNCRFAGFDSSFFQEAPALLTQFFHELADRWKVLVSDEFRNMWWTVRAEEAAAAGALNYDLITRDSRQSILKEAAVLRVIGRRIAVRNEQTRLLYGLAEGLQPRKADMFRRSLSQLERIMAPWREPVEQNRGEDAYIQAMREWQKKQRRVEPETMERSPMGDD